MPIRIPDSLPAHAITGIRKYFRNDRASRDASGYSSAGCSDPESDAHEDRNRDAAAAASCPTRRCRSM